MQLTIVQTLVLLCTVALIPQDANSTDILTLNQWLVFSNQYEHNVESLVFLILREGMKLITSQDRNYNICCNRENRTRTWQRVWHNRKGRTAGQEGDHSSDYLWPGPVDWMHTGAVGTWSTSAPLMSSRRNLVCVLQTYLQCKQTTVRGDAWESDLKSAFLIQTKTLARMHPSSPWMKSRDRAGKEQKSLEWEMRKLGEMRQSSALPEQSLLLSSESPVLQPSNCKLCSSPISGDCSK